jgi:hypothetical protein
MQHPVSFETREMPAARKTTLSEHETAVFKHETPQTDHTPFPAKVLTISLVIWLVVGGLAVLGTYSYLLQGRG